MFFWQCCFRRHIYFLVLFYGSKTQAFLRTLTACSTSVKGGEDKAPHTLSLCVINDIGVCCSGHP